MLVYAIALLVVLFMLGCDVGVFVVVTHLICIYIVPGVCLRSYMSSLRHSRCPLHLYLLFSYSMLELVGCARSSMSSRRPMLCFFSWVVISSTGNAVGYLRNANSVSPPGIRKDSRAPKAPPGGISDRRK